MEDLDEERHGIRLQIRQDTYLQFHQVTYTQIRQVTRTQEAHPLFSQQAATREVMVETQIRHPEAVVHYQTDMAAEAEW